LASPSRSDKNEVIDRSQLCLAVLNKLGVLEKKV